MLDTVFSVIGYVGFALIMVAYALLQTERLSARSPLYSALNLIGSTSVVISLLREWNGPSFVLESCWAVISTYGLWRALRRPQRTTTPRSSGKTGDRGSA